MSQFEYTDLNKFFVSIGVFLIGLTFLLPWLFFRENFDLLIKSTDLKSYTETAQHIISQRQYIVSYFPIIILTIAILTFLGGIFFCAKGIRGWNKTEKLKQESDQLANKIASQEIQNLSQYKSTEEIQTTSGNEEEATDNSIEVPINNLWELNHWGSDIARIENGKMIFSGIKTRLETDGSHVNLKDILEIGKFYKISCFVKADSGTTGQFQLWCHDNIGIEPNGSSKTIPYATPSTEGEKCSLRFEAKYNKNIRIHLQYFPGKGKIEVSDIRIAQLK